MADYITQIKSDSTSYNLKDTQAITSIYIDKGSNGNTTVTPNTNGQVTIDISDVVISSATNSKLGTVKVPKKAEDKGIYLDTNSTLTIDAISSVVIQGTVSNTTLSSVNREIIIPLASNTNTGVVAGGTYVIVDGGRLKLNLGNSTYNFSNLTIEQEDLDYSDFSNSEEKSLGVKQDKEGTRYVPIVTKEYLFNSLKGFNTDYLSNTYITENDFDTFKKEIDEKEAALNDILSNDKKINKKYITSLSDLPNLTDLSAEVKNTFYIYKSDNGFYTFTAEEIDNSYKWVCLSTPQREYETEDIDFANLFDKYNKYKNTEPLTDVDAVRNYLSNKYDATTTKEYLVDGNVVNAVSTTLVANNNDNFDYTEFEVLVTSDTYYFYLLSYSEDNNIPSITLSSSDTTITYNDTDLSSSFLGVE